MSGIIDRLLPLCGFELHRSRKHEVYRRHDGEQFFRSKTPSDWRAERNQISDLCHVLGMTKAQALQLLDRPRTKERADEPEAQLFAEERSPQPAPSECAPSQASPAIPSIQESKQDRKLAKRLARLERNQAAKRAKRQRRMQALVRKELAGRDSLITLNRSEIVAAVHVDGVVAPVAGFDEALLTGLDAYLHDRPVIVCTSGNGVIHGRELLEDVMATNIAKRMENGEKGNSVQ